MNMQVCTFASIPFHNCMVLHGYFLSKTCQPTGKTTGTEDLLLVIDSWCISQESQLDFEQIQVNFFVSISITLLVSKWKKKILK